MYFYVKHFHLVVNQKYEIRLSDEFVLRGNMALLRCPVPSFVSDYVRVTSWERIDGFLIAPGVISGKKINFYNFHNYSSEYDFILSLFQCIKMHNITA